MKNYFFNAVRAAAVAFAIALAAFLPGKADAQVVTQLPVFIVNNSTVYDFGNGPLELKVLLGTGAIFTSQGSGVGSTSGSATALTLTAVPTTPPCIGCAISGSGLTTQTVAAYNGVTSITLSAVATVPASSALAWGAACPSTVGTNAVALVQPGVGNDLPLYTTARICGGAQFGAGAQILPFAIGAH